MLPTCPGWRERVYDKHKRQVMHMDQERIRKTSTTQTGMDTPGGETHGSSFFRNGWMDGWMDGRTGRMVGPVLLFLWFQSSGPFGNAALSLLGGASSLKAFGVFVL